MVHTLSLSPPPPSSHFTSFPRGGRAQDEKAKSPGPACLLLSYLGAFPAYTSSPRRASKLITSPADPHPTDRDDPTTSLTAINPTRNLQLPLCCKQIITKIQDRRRTNRNTYMHSHIFRGRERARERAREKDKQQILPRYRPT